MHCRRPLSTSAPAPPHPYIQPVTVNLEAHTLSHGRTIASCHWHAPDRRTHRCMLHCGPKYHLQGRNRVGMASGAASTASAADAGASEPPAMASAASSPAGQTPPPAAALQPHRVDGRSARSRGSAPCFRTPQ